MAIQKTVLNHLIIAESLQKLYNVPADKIKRVEIGSANCYKICAGGKQYFLKEYQEAFSEPDLQREVRLNHFLLSAAFPTSVFITDVNGNAYNRINNRYIVLQEFVNGESYIGHDLPDKILFSAAKLLGKLHEILRGYELPAEMHRPCVEKFDIAQAGREYDALLEQTAKIQDKTLRERIREDLILKKELLNTIAPWGNYFDKVTYKNSHGDYSAMQILCVDDEIKAVIDFSSAAKIPASWELMRSYMQSAADTKNPAGMLSGGMRNC